MTRYILLRVEDDDEADLLLQDIMVWPSSPLLSPCQEHMVSVELVADIDPSDQSLELSRPSWSLQDAVRASVVRADELAAEWWAESS